VALGSSYPKLSHGCAKGHRASLTVNDGSGIGGSIVRRSTACVAASRPKSTSRPISTATCSISTRPVAKPATPRSLKRGWTLGQTSARALRSQTRGMIVRPTVRRLAHEGSRQSSRGAKHSMQRGLFVPKPFYKLRVRIEQTINELKRFKHVAMRCEKTDISYSAIIGFACAMMLVKFVCAA
jgi:hypothetical protein